MADTNKLENATGDLVENAMEWALDPSQLLDAAYGVLTTYGLKVIGAILTLLVGLWIAKIIKVVIMKSMRKSGVDATLTAFAASLSHMALKAFVLIAALGVLDVPIASFVTVLGAAGLAIGLALQGSLANFASGVLMIIFKPFKVGDFVEGGGVSGTVEEIGIFTTVMNTPDNKKTIVPNSKMSSDNITNYTAHDTRRVDLTVGIGYADDIDKARTSIQAVLDATPNILKEPAPQISVVEMGDSSVNFVVRPWTDPAHYWDVYFDVTEAVKKRFDADGISIPFPQRDVHIYEHKEG